MFTLTFGEVKRIDQAVHELLNKTFPTRAGAVKTAYWLGNLAKKIESSLQQAQVEYIKVVKKHAKLDDKGEFVPAMSPEEKDAEGVVTKESAPIPHSYVLLDDHKELLEKDMEEFTNIPGVTMKCEKFKIDEFEGVPGITPDMLLALEPILVDEDASDTQTVMGLVPN
jgi:hypothetical protein